MFVGFHFVEMFYRVQECNGMEYEKSSNQIDLRYIPDDMTFDQEPRETCTGVEDLSSFKPTTYR
jgi:hypothetical protein